MRFDASHAIEGFDESRHESFVVRFFATWDGLLHCRVTDVRANRSWIIRDAKELRAIISSVSSQEA